MPSSSQRQTQRRNSKAQKNKNSDRTSSLQNYRVTIKWNYRIPFQESKWKDGIDWVRIKCRIQVRLPRRLPKSVSSKSYLGRRCEQTKSPYLTSKKTFRNFCSKQMIAKIPLEWSRLLENTQPLFVYEYSCVSLNVQYGVDKIFPAKMPATSPTCSQLLYRT